MTGNLTPRRPTAREAPEGEARATVDGRGKASGGPSSARARNATEQAGVLAILTFIALRFVQRYLRATYTTYLTTEAEMPLVSRREDFLSVNEFASLKACSLEHPKLRVKSELNSAGFSKTRGFVVKFNLEGVEKFRTNPDYACFTPIFDRLRLPDANAFVMNILLCQLGDYDAYNVDELSVGIHLDTTVGIYSRHTYAAHQVSVLYNSVPSDMEGGELEVYEYGTGHPDVSKDPDEKVRPKENMMVTFRGDAYHQVRSYRTKSGAERVSLVLEQYKIGRAAYGKTMRYLEAYKSNMTMM